MSNQPSQNGYDRELVATDREKIKSLLARCKEYDDKYSDWQHLEEQRQQAQQLVLNSMNRTGKRAQRERRILKIINIKMQRLSEWLASFRNDASFRNEVVAACKELRNVPQLHYVLPTDDETIGNPCQALRLADITVQKLWQSRPEAGAPEQPAVSANPDSSLATGPVELLKSVTAKTGIEKWAKERHIGRSSLFEWMRSGGKPVGGKLSAEKCSVIWKAVEDHARELGLLNSD